MKKSKMSIEWNKVTSLSKIIAMVLFVILPFGGFVLGMKYQQRWMLNPNEVNCEPVGTGLVTAMADKPTPTESIWAQQVERFDFSDTIQITGKKTLLFTLAEPKKAWGMVPLWPDRCVNSISSYQGIGIQHQKAQLYWCTDKNTFARILNTSDPAAFIINAVVTNNQFESTSVNTNDHIRVYYQDSTTHKWKQALTMTSEDSALHSKNSLDLLLGYRIPERVNTVLLAAGIFTDNSITKDSVQRCYQIDFSTKKASKSSCNAIW